MPSKRIRDLIQGSAAAGHVVPVDDPAGATYRVPLGQGGGLPFLNASGQLAAPDAYLHRGLIDYLGVNWDTLTTAGAYAVRDGGSGGANYPPALYRWGTLVVTGDGSQYIVQTYFPHTTDPHIYYRVYYGVGWSLWRAAGSEYGSNASGSYVRFADGTQICWANVPFEAAAGAWTQSPTYSWPAAFVDIPAVAISYGRSGYRLIYNIYSMSTTSYSLSVYNFDTTVTPYSLNVIAIGRWK